MCDICAKAGMELLTFAAELEKKYPGTTIKDPDGKDTTVSPFHHVTSALIGATELYLAREVLEGAAKDDLLTMPVMGNA